MNKRFCIFIPTHGRPEFAQKTLNILKKLKCTKDYYLICDNEDSTLDKYKEMYGDKVIVFNKEKYIQKTDTMEQFPIRGCVVFARNAIYDIAEYLGYEYFLVIDDDTTCLRFNFPTGKHKHQVKEIDNIIDIFVDFLERTPDVKIAAFCQGGDAFACKQGDVDGFLWQKRKVMNSFFCATKRRVTYFGSTNEDVNMYALGGLKGDVFLSMYNIQLDQVSTQQFKGGLTETYREYGTYRKSMYTVMAVPSCCKLRYMGHGSPRLHHSLKYNSMTPMIISDKYKKK